MALNQILSWIFLLSGSLVLLSATVGILRMPSFYTRMHAASVNETLGTGLILLGLASHAWGNWEVLLKLGMILVFTVLTAPMATHALARAAYLYGIRPNSESSESVAKPTQGDLSSKS